MRTCERSSFPRSMTATLAAAIVLIAGCQPSDPIRQSVAGDVAVEGIDPVNGSISFLPTEGHSGPAASTNVVNGRYEFTSFNGPLPGAYRVTLTLANKSQQADPIQQPTMTGKADLMKESSESADSFDSQSSISYQARVEIGDGGESRHDIIFPSR